MLDFSGIITPQSILEEEDKQHHNTRDNSNPSREDVGIRQICSYLKQATLCGLGTDWQSEPEEGGDA